MIRVLITGNRVLIPYLLVTLGAASYGHCSTWLAYACHPDGAGR